MIKYNRTEREGEKEKWEDDEVPIRSSSTALKTVGKHRASLVKEVDVIDYHQTAQETCDKF